MICIPPPLKRSQFLFAQCSETKTNFRSQDKIFEKKLEKMYRFFSKFLLFQNLLKRMKKVNPFISLNPFNQKNQSIRCLTKLSVLAEYGCL